MDPCFCCMANGFVILLAPAVCLVLAQYLCQCHRLRKLGEANGCQAPPRLAQRDRLLGIDTLLKSCKNINDSTYLDLQQLRYAKHGDTYSFNSLGVTVINTVDPQSIQAVLAKQFNDFGLGPERKAAFDPLIGQGIFTADGHEWQQARKLIRPCFTRNEIHDVSMFEEHVERLLHHILRDSTPVDLQDLSHDSRLTIDVASKYPFGRSSHALGGLQEPWYKISGTDFAAAFNRAQHTIANFFSLGLLAFIVPKTQFQKDRKIVYDFVDQYIRKALSSQSNGSQNDEKAEVERGHYQVLHEYSKQTSDPEVLRSGLLHVLLAGADSTVSLLSNLLWLMLAQHPPVWERRQEEILTLNGVKPTFEILKQMRYLRRCINESLRLHPVVPINYRTALRDTTLPRGAGPRGTSPTLIPVGTMVGYHTCALHRRPNFLGSDAHEFRPGRWETIRPGWRFLPFNGGPRVCLGQGFAIGEVAYVTIRFGWCRCLQGLRSMELEREWGSGGRA